VITFRLVEFSHITSECSLLNTQSWLFIQFIVIIMATKHFYLLGESPSTAREVELPPAVEFEELQNIVASHFAIVKPNGKFDRAALATQVIDANL
jgi:hypothetical protein